MLIHRRLIQLAGQVWAALTVCVVAGLVVAACYIAQALLLAHALAALADRDYGRVLPWIVAALAVVAVRALLGWARELLTASAGASIRARIRDRLFAHLADLGPAHLVDARTGQTQSVLVDGVEGLDPYYSRYVPQVLITALVPAVLVAWLATVYGPAAIALGASVLLVLTVPRIWDATLLRRGRDHWAAFTDLAADYLEAMQGMPTLKAFGAVEPMRSRLDTRAFELFRRTMRQLKVSLVETGISAFLIQGGTVAAVLAAAFGLGGGTTHSEQLYVVLLVSSECFRPVKDLSKYWHAGYLGISAVDGIDALLGAACAVRDTGTATLPSHPVARSTATLAGTGGDTRVGPRRITIEQVSFRYPGRRAWALRDVTLQVDAGQTVAVVGRSGAGKSTLVALLLRFYDPTAGVIRVDGVDIAELPLAQLREQVAVVSQDTYLFHGTVADNLRLARPDATDEQVRLAARAARAEDFIAALPDGYDTVIAERGQSLSGGQRQRIAIARALLKDAPILILDEATSSVDARNEADIVAALARARQGRTCLTIAHRLSTVRDADRIVVLQDGQLVESGSHDQLVGRDGIYTGLIRAQEVASR